MDMKESVQSVLRQYANFQGRAGRSEFWWWILFTVLVGFLFQAVIFLVGIALPPTMNANGTVSPGLGGIISIVLLVLYLVVSLAFILPSIAVTVRRLHDSGRSGLYFLLYFIPFLGPIIMIVLCVAPSENGPNAYGYPPGLTMHADHNVAVSSPAPGMPAPTGEPEASTASLESPPGTGETIHAQRRPVPPGVPRMPIAQTLPPPRAASTDDVGATPVPPPPSA